MIEPGKLFSSCRRKARRSRTPLTTHYTDAMAARGYEDSGHGPAPKPLGSAAEYDSDRSISAMETGTVLGKHASQAPLVQVEHTGTESVMTLRP